MKWLNTQQKTTSLIDARDIAARLPDIMLDAQKIASTIQAGTHGRRRAGHGDHFWQYRNYDTQTDAVSRIDWRQSARSDHLYVREQEDERAQSIHIWIDPAPAMHYASAQALKSKYEYIFTLCIALAYQLTSGGERIITQTTAGVNETVNHPRHVERLAHHILSNPPHPNFALPKDGLVIIATDGFSHETKTFETLISNARAQNAKIYLLNPIDPTEQSYDFTGHVKFEDMQASDHFEIQNAKALQASYLNKFQAHQKMLDNLFTTDKTLHFTTDVPLIDSAGAVTKMLIL